MSPNLETSFWTRMGLQEQDHDVCVRAIEEVYTTCRVEEFKDQGYCSFTFLVTPSSSSMVTLIVQIRPRQHGLEPEITGEAQSVYGSLAPRVKKLHVSLPGRLSAFEMELLLGVPYSRVKSRIVMFGREGWEKRVRLVESFASFIARAWPTCYTPTALDRTVRADSPIFEDSSWLAPCAGAVGANIVPKLWKLARDLPDETLRRRAQDTLQKLRNLVSYPLALNHGDLIPTNILVDEETWEITGLVDWAEAEVLPFGTCLYGLEYLLGSIKYSSSRHTSIPTFDYDDGADELRRVFWNVMVKENPEMKDRIEEVRVMRDLGVLLWSGYAWDEGKIDRVVNEVDDVEEVACLRAFLGVEC
ncbi:hypothetical protein P280DRAFT_286289 [Massarina eburnea CBS 473.64]|uniref:Aminoglycoside phosphotransferase domain-containing protein n=1 Tax=Massarina eburnea CBS 473.64 TaxID=1395130 RepID=A0A6A6S1U8_9PLEO|nr:hypothetical protein P280DRAFT_286289 [Massarina eburnea CBS 473.64]